jgi:transcription-repair coupling factor (superfamily II helicase)
MLLAVEQEEIDEIRNEIEDRFGQPPLRWKIFCI